MIECSFCKIIVGKLSSNKIYETEKILAFAPLKEDIIAKGHMLVIPKKHYADFYDIPKEELHHIVDAIKIISQKLKQKYNITKKLLYSMIGMGISSFVLIMFFPKYLSMMKIWRNMR